MIDMEKHEFYMQQAIQLAKEASKCNEVPVGAVIVKDGEIIAEAFNFRETGKDATAHAEILAIQKACKRLGTWRLSGCDLYVTLEPCPMCAGAIINARLDRVFYGAKDARGGAMGSILNMCGYPLFSKPIVADGICEDACRELLQTFFEKKRRV